MIIIAASMKTRFFLAGALCVLDGTPELGRKLEFVESQSVILHCTETEQYRVQSGYTDLLAMFGLDPLAKHGDEFTSWPGLESLKPELIGYKTLPAPFEATVDNFMDSGQSLVLEATQLADESSRYPFVLRFSLLTQRGASPRELSVSTGSLSGPSS